MLVAELWKSSFVKQMLKKAYCISGTSRFRKPKKTSLTTKASVLLDSIVLYYQPEGLISKWLHSLINHLKIHFLFLQLKLFQLSYDYNLMCSHVFCFSCCMVIQYYFSSMQNNFCMQCSICLYSKQGSCQEKHCAWS